MKGMQFVTLAAVAMILTLHLSDAGVSYVRWGRTVCPAGTHKLYQGYMGGPAWNAKGDGSNYLCIHNDPLFVRPKAGFQGYSGAIWGVEFDLFNVFDGTFSTENIPGGAVIENDMVCVVCYVEGSFDKLVIPGRPDCGSTGYDLQYKGFLVTELNYADRQRSEFVCMDEAPEGRPGGTNNDNQGIIYPVEVACGSLPCNPFVNGYEMPCAVCTY